jgi:creatinine amidohydrolase/Fe(II)-dependent formamide hydrolase-like protein
MSEEKTLFDKNVELWERWTNSYMDTVSRAMDRAMEQSAAIQKQIEKTAAVALDAQLASAMAAIKALEKQVEMLSGRIDEILKKQE